VKFRWYTKADLLVKYGSLPPEQQQEHVAKLLSVAKSKKHPEHPKDESMRLFRILDEHSDGMMDSASTVRGCVIDAEVGDRESAEFAQAAILTAAKRLNVLADDDDNAPAPAKRPRADSRGSAAGAGPPTRPGPDRAKKESQKVRAKLLALRKCLAAFGEPNNAHDKSIVATLQELEKELSEKDTALEALLIRAGVNQVPPEELEKFLTETAPFFENLDREMKYAPRRARAMSAAPGGH
jgi:hypothetical protein